ncbi:MULTISPECIES: hypothetical protein [unclassified Streptomyces]|uniref:hypothetical protein n=1 Tax=unclassified Streptomyces TaxID=2593676 RepID=UPI00364DEEA2
MAGPEAYANHLAALCTDLTDAEFRRHAPAAQRAHHEARHTLLTRAAVLLGSGIPLFGPLHADVDLTLDSAKALGGGFAQATYRVDRACRAGGAAAPARPPR